MPYIKMNIRTLVLICNLTFLFNRIVIILYIQKWFSIIKLVNINHLFYRNMQNLWRIFEKDESQFTLHHLRRQSTFWLHWPTGWFVLPCVSFAFTFSNLLFCNLIKTCWIWTVFNNLLNQICRFHTSQWSYSILPNNHTFSHSKSFSTSLPLQITSKPLLNPTTTSPSFDKTTGKYSPHNKAWIKEKIYTLLRQQAGKA